MALVGAVRALRAKFVQPVYKPAVRVDYCAFNNPSIRPCYAIWSLNFRRFPT